MPKFYAKVPVRGHVWLLVQSGSAYDAESDALLAAARLQDKDLNIATGLIRLTHSPDGPVILECADDSLPDDLVARAEPLSADEGDG